MTSQCTGTALHVVMIPLDPRERGREEREVHCKEVGEYGSAFVKKQCATFEIEC